MARYLASPINRRPVVVTGSYDAVGDHTIGCQAEPEQGARARPLELVKVSAEVVGKLARVTAAITPESLGEVVIEVRAGTERFLARAADRGQTIPKHTRVVVVSSLGGRTVEVTPA